MIQYGDYLIAALGNKGVEILHRDQPETRYRIKLDDGLQDKAGRAIKLRMAGSSLFVASDNGVVVFDMAVPSVPRVVSAGNVEHIEAIDLYKNRLVAGGGSSGLEIFELPGSLVMASSIAEGGRLSLDNSHKLTIRFNELITPESLQQADAIQLFSIDPNTGVQAPVAVNIVTSDGGTEATDSYEVQFDRVAGSQMLLRINDARNVRGSGLWTPYNLHFSLTEQAATQPVIHSIENGVYHIGQQGAITIHGNGFRQNAIKMFVNQYPVDPVWVDEQTLQIPAKALDLLPYEPGQLHLRLDDDGLQTSMLGALVAGEATLLQDVSFNMTPDSADKRGGHQITVKASAAVILPGTRVVLRAQHGDTEIYTGYSTFTEAEGEETIDLRDNVVTLEKFNFVLPGVIDPDLYAVYLRIPTGNGVEEVHVGDFSYTLPEGLNIDLPNYPPMLIGASQVVGSNLFIGVKDGSRPTSTNRFLMEAGLEIYDINLWERPVRLSQLRLARPVYGLEVLDNLVYLAGDSEGLHVVDVNDLQQPLLVSTVTLPSHRALDVALNKSRQLLAVAASNDLGSGYIRFFDVAKDELPAASGYPNIIFSDDPSKPLSGAPLDVQWLNDELYVLFAKENQLHLAVFSEFGDNPVYTVQALPRAEIQSFLGSYGRVSLFVQHGLVSVTTDSNFLIYQQNDTGEYEATYWKAINENTTELLNIGGSVLQAELGGVRVNTIPYLALTSISPVSNSTIAATETIRMQFNNLINTDPAHLLQAITVNDASGVALQGVELTGINTLYGGTVEITITGDYSGAFTVNATNALLDIHGHNLNTPVTSQYQRINGTRPEVAGVARLTEAGLAAHYFHADGSETAVISGRNFGIAPDQLGIWIGETAIATDQIVSLSDTEVHVKVPDLQFGSATVSLPVRVERLDQGLHYIKYGAVTILPQIEIDDISPHTGPPRGGNRVDIYGRGFSHDNLVYFAGARAGDLRVYSSNHIQVLVPAGSFGPAEVTVENTLFPGEFSKSPVDYFYSGSSTGTVNLSPDKSSPVSALALNGQLLYVVTGGGFDVINDRGEIAKRLTSNVARLVLADISDPVNPQIVSKTFVNVDEPYHFDVTGGLNPKGFVDIALFEDELFAVGGKQLFHFDITLPADPALLNRVTLANEISDVVVEQGVLYIGTSKTIEIYKLNTDKTLSHLGAVPNSTLSGGVGNITVAGQSLWATIPANREVVEIELATGNHAVLRRFKTLDKAGNSFVPDDILVYGDKVLVSSGRTATVQLYYLDSEDSASPLTDLKLAYLVSNGDLYAGNIILVGQTLYIAGGQGDVQLFDIAPWLDNRFQDSVSTEELLQCYG